MRNFSPRRPEIFSPSGWRLALSEESDKSATFVINLVLRMSGRDITPEERARCLIDQMLEAAGWHVVDRVRLDISVPCAVREAMMDRRYRADYLLYIQDKVVGVLEAKREEVDVTSQPVIDQAVQYTRSLTVHNKTYNDKPPCFVFVSNGQKLYFGDLRNNEGLQELTEMSRPVDLLRLLGVDFTFEALPLLKDPSRKLRRCQFDALSAAESALKEGKSRILFSLATGSGKTFTACAECYRLLTHTPIRRILFLVDRTNLGQQALGEFSSFAFTEGSKPFTYYYNVSILSGTGIDRAGNVIISTIQKLYCMLSGSADAISDDEQSDELVDNDDLGDVVSMPEHPTLPPNFFDLIIIDECHRSIYGRWGSVLRYFKDAYFIGLTATPTLDTAGFFDKPTYTYSLADSIADGINVGPRVYRIATTAQQDGGVIQKGERITRRSNYSGQSSDILSEESVTYTRPQLNRSVFNRQEIRVVLETYRDKVFTELFVDPRRDPNYDYLPKTLIFAQNEHHASMIVEVAREVFRRPNDDNKFAQQITYSCGNSSDLIKSFRSDPDFRIAVTVTLVATGTDIKPLEVLIFMRDVSSETLYTQMIGRGVRTVSDSVLHDVTPNAHTKDCFFVIDAIGVTEHPFTATAPTLDPGETLPTLAQLLEYITQGDRRDKYLSLLGQRMARIYNRKSTDEDKADFSRLTGRDMKEMAERMLRAVDKCGLSQQGDLSDEERYDLVSPLPMCPDARELLLKINAGFTITLHPGEAEVTEAGFSKEEALCTTGAFEEFVVQHQDEIAALRLIRENRGVISYQMLMDLSTSLQQYSPVFTVPELWRDYNILDPTSVVMPTVREEWYAATNLIQLVRYALKSISQLTPLSKGSTRRFELWAGQNQRSITDDQKALLRQIVSVITSNGYVTLADLRNSSINTFALVRAFGGRQGTEEAINSLSDFLIYPSNIISA